MAGYAAALLDELMGRNRDEDPTGKRKTHWSDPEVCKYFLCSFCPHYLFTNTRADLGRCNKIHDEDLKASYQKSARFEKMGYEREFSNFLQSLISEVDKRIRRGEQRLILNSQPTPVPTTPQMVARQQRVEQLTKRISELVEEAETLGCEGNVDQSQEVMVLCEQLRDERTTLVSLNESERRQLEELTEPTKAMQVCETCGALLVIGDPHQRLDEHVMGKQHMGYAQIRTYLDGRRVLTGRTSAKEANDQPEAAPPPVKENDGSGDDVIICETTSDTDGGQDQDDGSCRQDGRRRDRDDPRGRADREERSRGSTSSRHRSRSSERTRSRVRSSPSPNRKHWHSGSSGRDLPTYRSNTDSRNEYHYYGRGEANSHVVEVSDKYNSSGSKTRDPRRDRWSENSGASDGWR
jgi:hypothetical protein